MRFQVDPALLRSEAADVAGAARTLAGMTVFEQLGALQEAIPGGSTAQALGGVASCWRTELTDLRSRVRSLGEALGAAGAGYEQIETVTTQAMGATR
ncbi:MAG: hypothetical protein ABI112_12560 [Terracoccus sp.]